MDRLNLIAEKRATASGNSAVLSVLPVEPRALAEARRLSFHFGA
jgi:hypothetical protein